MVTLNIGKTDFVNDFYSYEYAALRTLRIVKVQETFVNTSRNVDINGIVMQIEEEDANTGVINVIPCPTIIGMSNEYVTIHTADDSLLGVALTYDNIESCYLEIA